MRVSLSELQNSIYRSALALDLPVGHSMTVALAARRMAAGNFGSLESFVGAFDSLAKGHSTGFEIDRAAQGIFVPKPSEKLLSALYAGPLACDLMVAAAHSKIDLEKVVLHKEKEKSEMTGQCSGIFSY